MKIGVIISSNDPETVWNAFRFCNHALGKGDEVQTFLIGKGVEAGSLDNSHFPVKEQMRTFLDKGGQILACGGCLKLRNQEGGELCPVSTMADLHEIVRASDKVVSF